MDIIIVTRIYDEIIEYYNSIEFENLELDDLNDYPYIDTAYRQYDLENQMESINAPESLKRYLIKHFAYLMKNVFYLDMKKFKAKGAKGSYFVYTKDSPIIKEILLRSVSQNEHDVIIGRWLEGKIKDDSYYELVELSERLFQLIQQTDTVKQDVKNQWITALKISLQTEFAYTMTEMEFIVRQLFSFSLPFEYAENNEVSKSKGKKC